MKHRDPIIDELRRIREDMARKHDFDVRQLTFLGDAGTAGARLPQDHAFIEMTIPDSVSSERPGWTVLLGRSKRDDDGVAAAEV